MKKYLLLIILLLLPGVTHTRRFRKKYPPKRPLSTKPISQKQSTTVPKTTTPTAPTTQAPGPRSCANIPIGVPIPVTGPEISGAAPTTPKETEPITPEPIAQKQSTTKPKTVTPSPEDSAIARSCANIPIGVPIPVTGPETSGAAPTTPTVATPTAEPVKTETSTEVAPKTETVKPVISKNTANVAFDYNTLTEMAKKYPNIHVLGIFNDIDVPIKYNVFRSKANQTADVEVARQFGPREIPPQKSTASNITAGRDQQSYFFASVPEPLNNQKVVEGFFVLPGLTDIPDGSMAVPTAITIRKEGQTCNAYATVLLVKFEQSGLKMTSTKILHEVPMGPIACEKIGEDQHTQVGVGLLFAPTKKLTEPFDEQEVKPE